MRAPPIAWPLSPQASISAPAPGPSSGFLKTEPNVRALRGWLSLRRRCSSRTRARDLLAHARAQAAARPGRRPRRRARSSAGSSARARAGRPCARRVAETTSADASTSRISLPYAPAFMRTAPPTVPGMAQPNSMPASAASVRAPHDGGQRRAAAAAHARAVDLDRRERPLEPHRDAVVALVGDEQVRAEADHGDVRAPPRRPRRAPPASSACRGRPREEARRAAGADRRQPRERRVGLHPGGGALTPAARARARARCRRARRRASARGRPAAQCARSTRPRRRSPASRRSGKRGS